MNPKMVAIVVTFIIAVLAAIVVSSMGLAKTKVEVCMEFNGSQNCATAAGDTREHALRTATSSACALIAGGVGDTIACERKTPLSVKWLK